MKTQPPALGPVLPSSTPTEQMPPPSPSTVTSSPLPTTEGQPVPVVPQQRLSILPWLLAALALAAGAIFLLWRRRPSEAFAGLPDGELVTPVEVAPQPVAPPPPPAPRNVVSSAFRAPPSAPVGLVSSRLRPSLEIGVRPLRCVVNDQQVEIEFELELYNSGTAPARAIHAEASLINASATQDQDLAAFFANASPTPDRLDVIPPMRRIALTSRVVAPRSAIQEYELAGRKSFVPLIAFNALYQWSGGSGQTSAAYLVGRETRGDKLGPLRLDQGPRELGGLGARELPVGIRN
ncbi:MAG TPA: hypothetical protein VF098_05295 [Sphingomicrobium sp.]